MSRSYLLYRGCSNRLLAYMTTPTCIDQYCDGHGTTRDPEDGQAMQCEWCARATLADRLAGAKFLQHADIVALAEEASKALREVTRD